MATLFLFRRCGLVVCDRCSSHRIRLPPNEIIQDPAVDPSHYPLIAMHPQRVCDACVRLPIKEVPSSSSSNTRRRATAPVTMRRSGSSQSLMSECPVCGHDLLGMAKKDQENHLQMCLNAGSPPVRPPRYLGKRKIKGSLTRLKVLIDFSLDITQSMSCHPIHPRSVMNVPFVLRSLKQV